MIVKIQRPLMTNGEEPMALLYDRDRTFQVQVPLSHVEQLFKGNEVKAYCRAELDEDGLLRLGKKIRCNSF